MNNDKGMLAEEWIIAVLLCAMVVMVTGQVLSRYVFHTSLSHTEELVRYLFVWTTFLGAAAAGYRKKHISIAGALRFLPERVFAIIRFAGGIGAVIFMVVLVVYGLQVVLLQFRTHQTTAALGYPMWIIGLAVPLCSALLVIRLLMNALGYRKDR